MVTFKHRRTCLLLAAGVSALTAGSALAQESREAAIEEVVVTARKREESLQEVPVAISATTGVQMQRQGVRTLMDLGRSVPSLQTRPATSSASTVSFVIRGQTAGDTLMTIDQAVGVYVDGIYIARQRALNGAFFDIERAEVLKGPQGTLYGRNTTGGAINIWSRSPDFEGLHGYVSGDLGQYRLRTGRVAVNLPLLEDKLAMRLGYQVSKRKGFGESATTGQDIGGQRNQQVFRALARFEPTSTFRADVKFERYRQRENGNLDTPFGVLSDTSQRGFRQTAAELFAPAGSPAGCAFNLPPATSCITLANLNAAITTLQGLATRARTTDFYTTYTQIEQVDDGDSSVYGLTLTWDPADDIQLKSITAYRTLKTKQVFDLDGTPFSILEVGAGVGGFPLPNGKPGSLSSNFTLPLTPEQVNYFFSQEFNVSGQAFDGRLNWLGGVFYSKESGLDNQQSRVFPAASAPIGANGAPTATVSLNFGEKIINDSWSLYTQNDFKFTDQLSLTLGARYTEEHKGLQSLVSNFNPFTGLYSCATGATTPPNNTSPIACRTRAEKTFSGSSYLASVNYKVNDDVLVYLKTSKGFRGGAFQLRAPTLPPASPEIAKDIEAGLKSDWFDRRLRVNLAGYRTKYSNKQENTIFVTAAGTLATIIQNAASATIKGFEAEITAVPIDGLTLNATYSYFDGKYNSFPGALQFGGRPPADASGEKLPNPPHLYSLNARYAFPVGPGDLGLTASYAYTSHANPSPRFVNPFLDPAIVKKLLPSASAQFSNGSADLGLLNLSADYTLEDQGLTFQVFVTNATNKKYAYAGTDGGSVGGIQVGVVQEPRMWGVSVRKSFGAE